MRIAWHTWEPALTNNNGKASSGGGFWLRSLFRRLRHDGHQIYWVSDHDEVAAETDGTVDVLDVGVKCDVLFCAWRWPMPDYPERQAKYEDQMRAIAAMLVNEKRVIIHDQDHKLTKQQSDRLFKDGVEIYEPAFFPLFDHDTLFYPNPHIHSFSPSEDGPRPNDIVYIGNNYERFDQTQIFFGGDLPPYFSPTFYGNWMELGPKRATPEEVKTAFPNVTFGGRLEQRDIEKVLSTFEATIHLFKPSYGPTGFMTMRWAEAAAAGTVGFIPIGFRLPNSWLASFDELGLVVGNKETFITNFFKLRRDREKRQAAIEMQQNLVNKFMAYRPWQMLFSDVQTH